MDGETFECRHCHKNLPVEEFCTNPIFKNRLQRWCRKCQGTYYKEVWLPANREKRRLYQAKWYADKKLRERAECLEISLQARNVAVTAGQS